MVTHVELITPIVKLNLKLQCSCQVSDIIVILKRIITFTRADFTIIKRVADRDNKQVIFKNYASFTECGSKKMTPHVDNAKDIDVVMLMYN